MLRPDLTDMLIADHALAIDHEGLGHPARAERHLHPALGVKADPCAGVAVPLSKARHRLSGIAERNGLTDRALTLPCQTLGGFRHAGTAPASKDIDPNGPPGFHNTGGEAGPAGDFAGQVDLRTR